MQEKTEHERDEMVYCLDCKHRYGMKKSKCPKCGSRRRRAYLKESEKEELRT